MYTHFGREAVEVRLQSEWESGEDRESRSARGAGRERLDRGSSRCWRTGELRRQLPGQSGNSGGAKGMMNLRGQTIGTAQWLRTNGSSCERVPGEQTPRRAGGPQPSDPPTCQPPQQARAGLLTQPWPASDGVCDVTYVMVNAYLPPWRRPTASANASDVLSRAEMPHLLARLTLKCSDAIQDLLTSAGGTWGEPTYRRQGSPNKLYWSAPSRGGAYWQGIGLILVTDPFLELRSFPDYH
ncbi:hypothetical protein CC78DRAFT_578432 [Lojkania enalia]|uniref:Uncharacterized protein n=1 Tax=Lojkania enalia TaxID=147567 RepID=A0A9P4N8T0_9PLEO|nr:hypothetical protein CC78DRAFT_578432 [Didymosphaeria enalia]